MAAGCITLAHNSGGPKSDIIEPGVSGFLAATKDEYAEALSMIFSPTFRDTAAMREMQKQARARALQFSDAAFAEGLVRHMTPMLRAVRGQ